MTDDKTTCDEPPPTRTTSQSGHVTSSSASCDDVMSLKQQLQQQQDEEAVGRRHGCDRMALFTANAGCMLLLWMVGVVYTGASVRTLERRFGLRSTETGIMMACGDIVHMSIVVFVGYFGRDAHKPRIMCVMALFSAVGFVLMVLPHWMYNSHSDTAYQRTYIYILVHTVPNVC